MIIRLLHQTIRVRVRKLLKKQAWGINNLWGIGMTENIVVQLIIQWD